MSRFGFTESFQSPRSTQECSQAATESLSSLRCHPARGEDGIVAGAMGTGWVIRLIGGLIARARWFPIRLTVAVRDHGDRREVTVRVDENFGVGSLLGVEKKIRAHCDDMGGQLSRLLKSRLV